MLFSMLTKVATDWPDDRSSTGHLVQVARLSPRGGDILGREMIQRLTNVEV